MTVRPEGRLTFCQIANFWPAEPATYPFQDHLDAPLSMTDHAEAANVVLQELVAAIWRREFEPSPANKATLALPWSQGIKRHHDGKVFDLVQIGQRKPKWKVNPVHHPAEKKRAQKIAKPLYVETTTPELIEFFRADLREGLKQSMWCPGHVKKAPNDALAKLPLDFYPADFRKTCLEALSIAKSDFRDWCKRRGFSVPAFSRDSSAKNRGRKVGSGSYFEMDKPLLVEMKALIERGKAKSVHDAARQVAQKAVGSREDDARIKRLCGRYKEHKDEIASWNEFFSN